MEILSPTTDKDLVTFLLAACKATVEDIEQEMFYLQLETIHRLADLLRAIHPAHTEYNEATARYQKYESMTQKTAAQLCTALQWLWTTSGSEQPDEITAIHHALAAGGTIPMPKSRTQWLRLGIRVLQYDRSARENGGPGVPNCYALELATSAASRAQAGLRKAFARRQKAHSQVLDLRSQLIDLYRSVVAEMRESLSFASPRIQRILMRTYGVVFAEDVGKDKGKAKGSKAKGMAKNVTQGTAGKLSTAWGTLVPTEDWISSLYSVHA